MRGKPLYPAEDGRVLTGQLASKREWGCVGFFHVQRNGVTLRIVSSDGKDWEEAKLPGISWEHVSVSCEDRTPTWAEMQYVKTLFWRPEETVLQIHPPESIYVNIHRFVLHMWRPIGVKIPLPPRETIE